MKSNLRKFCLLGLGKLRRQSPFRETLSGIKTTATRKFLIFNLEFPMNFQYFNDQFSNFRRRQSILLPVVIFKFLSNKLASTSQNKNIQDPRSRTLHLEPAAKRLLGFTLLELMISITVFSLLGSIIASAMMHLASSKHRASLLNEIRVEAEDIVSEIEKDFREGILDYDSYIPSDNILPIVTKVGDNGEYLEAKSYVFDADAKTLKIKNKKWNSIINSFEEDLSTREKDLTPENFTISHFAFEVFPPQNPSNLNNPQFQPRLNIRLSLQSNTENISLDFQTSVSSRYYEDNF